jgi:hypothetical protein
MQNIEAARWDLPHSSCGGTDILVNMYHHKSQRDTLHRLATGQSWQEIVADAHKLNQSCMDMPTITATVHLHYRNHRPEGPVVLSTIRASVNAGCVHAVV